MPAADRRTRSVSTGRRAARVPEYRRRDDVPGPPARRARAPRALIRNTAGGIALFVFLLFVLPGITAILRDRGRDGGDRSGAPRRIGVGRTGRSGASHGPGSTVTGRCQCTSSLRSACSSLSSSSWPIAACATDDRPVAERPHPPAAGPVHDGTRPAPARLRCDADALVAGRLNQPGTTGFGPHRTPSRLSGDSIKSRIMRPCRDFSRSRRGDSNPGPLHYESCSRILSDLRSRLEFREVPAQRVGLADWA
jgi:hypothetical protein